MIRSTKSHLDEAGETYFQHFRVAFGIAACLAVASAAAALHALVPGLCVRTASRRVAHLHAFLESRSRSSIDRQQNASRTNLRQQFNLDVTSS